MLLKKKLGDKFNLDIFYDKLNIAKSTKVFQENIDKNDENDPCVKYLKEEGIDFGKDQHLMTPLHIV